MAATSSVGKRAADGQRWVVRGLLAAMPVVFLPGALSAFSTVKTAVLFAGVAVLLALQLARVIADGRVSVPRTALAGAAVALAVALAVAAFSGDILSIGLLGAYKRHGGLLQYWSYLLVLLVVLRRFDTRSLPSLAVALLVGAGVVAVFAVLQALGVGAELFARAEGAEGVPATLGNTNFVAGYLAISTPLLAWMFFAVATPAARVGLGMLSALVVAGIVIASSAQGPLAAAAGLSLFGVAWARTQAGALRRWAAPVWGGLAAVGAAIVGWGLAGHGPMAALGQQRSFELRRWYWDSAIAMWSSNPLTGVGLDQYGTEYLRSRPLAAALSLDLNQSNDAAHSVPLHLLAGGGLLLAAAYLVFVGVVVGVIVRAFRTAGPARLLPVGAFAGAWLAYQVQAAVSIDVPPLALLHYVLAAGIAVSAGIDDTTEVMLPWGRRGGAAARTQRRVGVIAATVLGVGLVFLALIPLRADLAAGAGVRMGAGDPAALERLDRAIALAPWEGAYWMERGFLLAEAQQPAEALASLQTATRLIPGNLAPLITGARVADSSGQAGVARELYGEALTVEPQHPDLKVEVARFELSIGNREAAQELVAEALAVDPDNAAAAELQATLQTAG